MPTINISAEDMAACHDITMKAANEAATCALAEAIAEIKAKRAEEEACRVEAEEAEAARRAEEEAEARQVADEEKAETTCQAEEEASAAVPPSPTLTPAMSIDQLLPLELDTDFLMPTPEDPAPPFSTLDAMTSSSSPATVEEDELDDNYIPPKIDLASISAFTPSAIASELSLTSGYHLHDCSLTVTLASTSTPSHSPQVTIMDPAKTKALKSSKAAGKKKTKRTLEEMPQITSAEPINVELLQNNVHELVNYFGKHGQECGPRGYGHKCSACAGVSTSHCSFAVPSPNAEFTLSIAHCIGTLNDACRALDLSRMHTYHTLLAAELEQVKYAHNCVTVVKYLKEIIQIHSFAHLQTIHGISSSFSHDTLDNLIELAAELKSWLPSSSAISALEVALERVFALHTLNLRAHSMPTLTGFPCASETVAIQEFSNSLRPRNLQELGGIFGNLQLYSPSLEDYSTLDPSGSSSVRVTHEGNTEYSVNLGVAD
ncbi:hypothetical protein BDQ17DRAFT_1335482 [Cyathus striatus]|nr:hypothetical protein BDQ17DRAFT_1335482 [Cyathus striatus]